ncbi:MAG: hypothetical protein P8M30_00860 [Planctomycetaceae bacterium]|jgi:hypothetical protein|nr:hypothetical protein [bacterium]MDG2387844.1 hypothetical protein [Planctomycetaceae bacterium]
MAADFSAGTSVQVIDGVNAPDLPEHSIAGWTGTITQASGKKGARKIFIEWDDQTVDAMSDAFKQACEEKQLYHLMVCLTEADIESV